MKLEITGLKVDAGGEGSRGGRIIGRTSGGKPIYENHNHPGHGNFSAGEHSKAEQIHRELHDEKVKKMEGLRASALKHVGPTFAQRTKALNPSRGAVEKLASEAGNHLRMANKHRKSVLSLGKNQRKEES